MQKLISLTILLVGFTITANSQVTTTFSYTGNVQTYTVPPCVYSITVSAVGAKGGGQNGLGGLGATVSGTVAVTPGQVLEVYVGGMGACPGAGWNGGGTGQTGGGPSCGGGGASDVRIAPYTINDRVIVAAGGGGIGGGDTYSGGGAGGCATGVAGLSSFGGGGGGGSQSAGGTGGFPWGACGSTGGNGSFGQGGIGGIDNCYGVGPGGGGGGGYYGGGGGGSDDYPNYPLGGGGGGGGSSLVPSGGSCTSGNNNGNGQVVITASSGGPAVTFLPASPSVCTGQSVQIIASGALSYSWSPATGLNTTTGDTVVASPASTQTYMVTFTNAMGCTDSVPVTVTVNPYPVLSFNPAQPAICVGDSVSVTANGAGTYAWSPATGLSSTSGSVVWAFPVTTQSYLVSGTTAGCTTIDTVTVDVNPLPSVSFSPANPSFCAGQSVSVTASGAVSFAWSPAGGLNTTSGSVVTANPASTTTYTVVGTSGVGCSDTANLTVTVNPLPVVSAGPDAILCLGFSQILNGTPAGAVSYSWSPATGLSNPSVANPTATPVSTTTYTLTVTDANGCTNSDPVTITVASVTAAFSANPLSGEPPLTVTFTNTSSPGSTGFTWNYGDGNTQNTTLLTTQNTYDNTGNYTVSLIAADANGCLDTATVIIIVEFPFSIIIPNVFSPNGDNSNDVFEVIHTGVSELVVDIYDRWGIYMYGYNDLNGKWDGTRDGTECPEGVYYYVITVTTKSGEVKTYQSSLTLMRLK